jgi:TRAP-type C4-dicarboxylate transport system substrate-binding protein
LHLATAEVRGAPYTKDAEYFADRVDALTGGTVRVEVDYEAIPWTPASEERLTTMVQQGETELAFVPPRIFDTLGITGFEALQTPLLIDSPELAGEVATSDIATSMLDGLADDGLVGLGLVYEGLRRPLATNGAVTRATDFEGLTIRVPPSDLTDRIFTALGAVPDHGVSHFVSTTGTPYPLVETELALADTDYSNASTVTANLTFFPKYQAILANPDALDNLTDAQQQAIRDAAADTAAASVQMTSDEQDLAETYCESSGDLVFAPAGELSAMRAKLQPVVDSLRRDHGTAEAIEAIEELKSTTTVPRFILPPACLPPTGDGARLPSPPAAPTP